MEDDVNNNKSDPENYVIVKDKKKDSNKDGDMVSVTTTKSNSEKCHIGDRVDVEKLKCKNCEKLHHYICTNLPAYQVYMFAEGAATGNIGYTCEQWSYLQKCQLYSILPLGRKTDKTLKSNH